MATSEVMARPSPRLPFAIWTVLVAAAVCVAHLPAFVHRLLDGDEAIYGSIAALMNLGKPLYGAGGVDNKPPGVFWVYSGVFRLFGTYQMTAIHAAGFVSMAATCVLIYFVARRLTGPRPALIAALFYGLLTAAGNPRLLASNTEIFMMLPLTASVLLMLWRRWFWCGVLLVAAGVFRQSAAVNVLLVGLAIVWLQARGARLHAAAMFGSGLLAGLAAGAALVAFTGSLPGFWRWTVQTLVGYAAGNWIPSQVWGRAKDSVVPFMVEMAVFWIAALSLASRWRTLTVEVRLMAAWLAIAMAGSLAGGHLSWHYFIQAMGPLAVMAALGLERLRPKRSMTAAVVVGIAVPLGAWWVFDLTSDPLTYDFTGPVPHYADVSSYVRDHTGPGDRVFVWGDWPAVYVEADRLMSGRFPGFLRGFARGSDLPPNNWDTAPDVWPLLQSDLDADPPRLIVDTAPAGWSDFSRYPMADYPVLAQLVASRYRVLATVDGVVIYERSGG
ncbi:MAG TPA: glycosyltransferase family 39 protein [Candidatus Dormibacteraeota bacterium]|nr:glycosyltransferase family 39 protein [Candidatus Dormibacteraeota bacterium]